MHAIVNTVRRQPPAYLPATLRFFPWLMLFAALMAGLIAWRIAHRPGAPSLLPLLAWQVAVWAPWLVYYPAIRWLSTRSERLPFGPLLRGVLQILGALAVAASHLAWYWALSSAASPLRSLPETKYGAYAFFFVFWFVIDLVLYQVVLNRPDARGAAPQTAAELAPPEPDDTSPDHRQLFVVRSGRTRHVVPASEVRWIEAQGYYAALHTASGCHLVRESLTKLEQSLDPERFVRIHRSTIVNTDYLSGVTSTGNGTVTVSIGGDLGRRASRAGLKKLKQRFPHLG